MNYKSMSMPEFTEVMDEVPNQLPNTQFELTAEPVETIESPVEPPAIPVMRLKLRR